MSSIPYVYTNVAKESYVFNKFVLGKKNDTFIPKETMFSTRQCVHYVKYDKYIQFKMLFFFVFPNMSTESDKQ